MRWVGSRFTSADTVELEHTVIASSGDLAYTVGFERSRVSVEGGAPGDMVIRATHIYRRIDGDWKLVHRHADFPLPIPPPDERPARTPAPQDRVPLARATTGK
jgi:ketosteroid isomerase-like protein